MGVLEQIADGSAPGSQQLLGIGQHDVLAQQQDRGVGPRLAQTHRGPQSCVSVTRWHPDADNQQVGAPGENLGVQSLTVTDIP